jgi:protein-disulfide isomerase
MNPNRVLPFAALILIASLSDCSPVQAQQPAPTMPSPEQMLQEWQAAQVWPLDLSGVPALGPPDAPIRIVEYADYLCGTCKGLAKAWTSFLAGTDGKVLIYFKNYPLDRACNESIARGPHPGACWLALGGICAAEQKNFWAYSHLAFAEAAGQPQAQTVVDLAVRAGLDRAAMESCLHAPETMRRLKTEIAEAAGTGVRGTPTLFVNGRKLPHLGYLTVWLNAEAQRLGLFPAGAP